MPEYTARPATSTDYGFLREVHHRAYRALVDRHWGWDERVQERLFAESCDPGRTSIIVSAGRDIGACQLHRDGGDLWVVDIAILPEHQRCGLGSAVLRDVLEVASSEGLTCRLGVLKVNDEARRLYERTGFATDGETDSSMLMGYPPGRQSLGGPGQKSD